MPKRHLLLFGGTGAVGTHLSKSLRAEDWHVTIVSRFSKEKNDILLWNPLDSITDQVEEKLNNLRPIDAVCWAQGVNTNDDIYDFDKKNHLRLYEANVLFILESLFHILRLNLLGESPKLCIVSSIWQNIARQNKLSYGITKSALRGLVLSLATDLGKRNYMVNAVLPGVLDTPMTRRNLTPVQVNTIINSTGHHRLPSLDDLVQVVKFLCSAENTGVTGQFIKVDLGFSDVHII